MSLSAHHDTYSSGPETGVQYAFVHHRAAFSIIQIHASRSDSRSYRDGHSAGCRRRDWAFVVDSADEHSTGWVEEEALARR